VNNFLQLQSRQHGGSSSKTTGAAPLTLASQSSAGKTAETAPLPSEHVTVTINGWRDAVDLDPRTTLIDALREHFG
jgi:xanthine dehydrogenase YagT iron-sulfur-binding subunit